MSGLLLATDALRENTQTRKDARSFCAASMGNGAQIRLYAPIEAIARVSLRALIRLRGQLPAVPQ